MSELQVRRTLQLGMLVLGFGWLACSQQSGDATPAVTEQAVPLSVYVVNYPLQYFAERIGGKHVNVSFPAPQGVDPAYWSPDAEVVVAYQEADVILLNGAGYARWVGRASLPYAKLVDTSASFRERLIPLEGTVTHQHGPTGEHAHVGFAFTSWLDPTLAAEQARAIAQAFSRVRPEHEADFRAKLEALETDLRALDAQLAAAAARLEHTPLLLSHPVYQYLVRYYGLNARSLHLEPDEPPDPSTWRELRELLAEYPARWMLWEATPLPETARTLRQLGVESRVIDPCGNVAVEGDFLMIMQRNAVELESIAQAASSGSGS